MEPDSNWRSEDSNGLRDLSVMEGYRQLEVSAPNGPAAWASVSLAMELSHTVAGISVTSQLNRLHQEQGRQNIFAVVVTNRLHSGLA